MPAGLDVTALARPSDEAERHELVLASVWIGREDSNQICITDFHISGFHAQLQNRGGIFYVHDLSSSGTWVNGQRLPKNSDGGFELRNDDVRTCHTPAYLASAVSLRPVHVTTLTGASVWLSSQEGRDRWIWRARRLPSRGHDRDDRARAAHRLPSREALFGHPHPLLRPARAPE